VDDSQIEEPAAGGEIFASRNESQKRLFNKSVRQIFTSAAFDIRRTAGNLMYKGYIIG